MKALMSEAHKPKSLKPALAELLVTTYLITRAKKVALHGGAPGAPPKRLFLGVQGASLSGLSWWLVLLVT